MKLFTLLDAHRTSAATSGSLKESLGDGHLVKRNRIYAAIRSRTLSSGFRFSNRVNESYLALSLSQLDSIMGSKEIPYLNNVSVLESLEGKIPKQTTWDDISDNLKGNHVFHEACHAVAKSVSQNIRFDGPEGRILLLLLEESFANACELLGIIDADDQIHRIFYELNSYVYMLDDRSNLVGAVKEMGLNTVLRFLVLAYLHANFLRLLEEKDLERVFKLCSPSLDTKQKKTLRALSKITFKLNPRFREVTTRFYLKLNGITKEVASLKTFDFIRILEDDANAKKLIDSFGSIVD